MRFFKSQQKHPRRRIFLISLALLMTALLLDYVLYPQLPVGGRSFNRGQNGLWMKDDWYFGRWKSADFNALTQRLKQQQISSAYFHVRYIGQSGNLRFHFPKEAQTLNQELKQRAPQVKSIAWVFIGNERAITDVDLSSTQVRRNIVREMQWLTMACDFDGVQIDYEISSDNDTQLLQLLKEIKAVLPVYKTLSVATPLWLPRAFSHWGWSEEFFAQVAAQCDELVVMGYDSGLYFPRHYVWLMKQQAIRVTRAAQKGNPACRVLIGVPTYEAGGLSHHAHAENLKLAIKGVREGLPPTTQNFMGLAIFADYTTDEAEWKTWNELWLQK